MAETLYIGLMSGTSVDAIDCALLGVTGERFKLLATHQHDIPEDIRKQIIAISQPGDNEIEQMGVLDRELGRLFAEATLALLHAEQLQSSAICAIGSHGQTVRHHPPLVTPSRQLPFTLQIGDPNTLAEFTGITTVADFRRRDMAAGGEGAPLAPAFHAAAFARPGNNRAIVNIGGMANASILEGETLQAGFDTGPGNTLLDGWIMRQKRQRYDNQGHWAASGQVHHGLLQQMLSHPYFTRTGPRSTGKESFHLAWLDGLPAMTTEALPPADVQATLAELTASSIAQTLMGAPVALQEVYICGGGAHNVDMMSRLKRLLTPLPVLTTQSLGMDPDWVEAAAFAWLAHRTINNLSGNSPAVTGASGPRVLGGIYPAGNPE